MSDQQERLEAWECLTYAFYGSGPVHECWTECEGDTERERIDNARIKFARKFGHDPSDCTVSIPRLKHGD